MTNGIKFHSIFYRYTLFIFSFFIPVLYKVSDAGGESISFFNGALIMESGQLKYIIFLIFIITIGICSFVN